MASAGSDIEVRGFPRAVTVTGITSASSIQINAVTGPLSFTGTGTPTIRLFGVHGAVTLSGVSLTTDTGNLNEDTDAIKAKTDNLTFTVANQVDSNTESINAVTIIGAGVDGNKFRV